MKKFSKILESRKELLSKLGTTEDEIEDALVDLTDLGFILTIEDVYLSPSGTKHYDTDTVVGIPEYFPMIEIEIEKPKKEGNEGEIMNWDGSVYYEENQLVLESISHSVYRLRSMFSGKARVFCAIRNIHHIVVRVVFEQEVGKDIVNFEEIWDLLQVKEYENYHIERTSSYAGFRKKNMAIKINCNRRSDRVDITNPKDSVDRIVQDMLSTKLVSHEIHKDNRYQLKEIFDEYIADLFKKSNKFGKLQYRLGVEEQRDSENRVRSNTAEFVNTVTGDTVVKIQWYYDEEAMNSKITTAKGGLFKAAKVITFDLYEMNFTVELIRSKKD
jgi:hypothetical protein